MPESQQPYHTTYFKSEDGGLRSAIHAEDVMEKFPVQEVPEVAEEYKVKQKQLNEFNDRIKEMAEKYKVNIDLLLEHVVNEA